MLEGELKTRAIIGGIRNITYDILERPRPKAQYIHYWRSLRKKIIETLPESTDPEHLKGILGILNTYPGLRNQDSPGIAKDLRDYFTSENLISV